MPIERFLVRNRANVISMTGYPAQASDAETASDRYWMYQDWLICGEAIRGYLPLLAETAVHISDRIEIAEESSLEIAGSWAYEAGVHEWPLAKGEVPSPVLGVAGLKESPAAILVGRYCVTELFTIVELDRQSGESSASVRNALSENERVGRVVRATTGERPVPYRLSK